MTSNLLITCEPEDLDQGLFGNVLAHTIQILPYLFQQGVYPAWHLRSKHYGDPPDQVTIPGSVDLAYIPPQNPSRTVSLVEMRRRHGQVLGGDWAALSALWNAYFKIPPRVLAAADGSLPQGRVLGIHYRGTDKQTSGWDSNPITQSEFISLLQDFLQTSPGFNNIFVGTDEPSFTDHLRSMIALPVTEFGAAEFHMSDKPNTTRREKGDLAMRDCLLMSHCQTVIQTSSALPSFAKVLNPSLEVYRTAASKLFSNMPYFPVAYVPVLPVSRPGSKALLDRTMQADWTSHASTERFKRSFSAVPRWPKNHALFGLAERAGAGDVAAKFFTGYR